MINTQDFLIHIKSSLREAMGKIQQNTYGIVFLADDRGVVVGLLTDGDIRRYLISGGGIQDPAENCSNTDFVFGQSDMSRELLIKKLDGHVKVIPILNSHRRLVDIMTKDKLPLRSEQRIYARARAPVRISFGGGGSDLTHYFSEVKGAVINATISLYTHATLKIRDDQRVVIDSRDVSGVIDADCLHDALLAEGQYGLVQAVLRTISPAFGFELYLHSDYPRGSGLGGSATVAAAILACFNQFRVDKWNPYELVELAYQAERLMLGISGGWQDQYAAVFGGLNFIEFHMKENLVHPLRVHTDVLSELEENLVLCNLRTSHESGSIHDHQREQMSKQGVKDLVAQNVKISYELRDLLLRGNVSDFGVLLDRTWNIKKKLSERISTDFIDRVYDDARLHGALGGKLLGAGGGGYFLFCVLPKSKHQLMSYLETQGLALQPFRFDSQGVQAWLTREQGIDV